MTVALIIYIDKQKDKLTINLAVDAESEYVYIGSKMPVTRISRSEKRNELN